MLIAIYAHGSRAGKDTTGDYIAELARARGLEVDRRAFADKMKLVAARALGLQGDDAERVAMVDDIKLNGEVGSFVTRTGQGCAAVIDGRDFIIGLAEGIRALAPAFWIDQALYPDWSGRDDHLTLLTDLRFLPEATAVHDLGGFVIEVMRPDAELHNEDLLPEWAIDAVVINDGTLEDLRSRAERAWQSVCEEFFG